MPEERFSYRLSYRQPSITLSIFSVAEGDANFLSIRSRRKKKRKKRKEKKKRTGEFFAVRYASRPWPFQRFTILGLWKRLQSIPFRRFLIDCFSYRTNGPLLCKCLKGGFASLGPRCGATIRPWPDNRLSENDVVKKWKFIAKREKLWSEDPKSWAETFRKKFAGSRFIELEIIPFSRLQRVGELVTKQRVRLTFTYQSWAIGSAMLLGNRDAIFSNDIPSEFSSLPAI